MEGPLHCPACGALVVDRRFANCTTCRAELPADWVLAPEQLAQLERLDQHARAEHAAILEELDVSNDPTSPTDLTIDPPPD
jgi:hypothetical protein